MFCRQYTSPRQTPNRMCRVPGCGRKAFGFGNLCAKHARNVQRHGHPLQRALPRRELRNQRLEVESFINRRDDQDARIWGLLEDHWKAFAKEARGLLHEMLNSGRPYSRFTKLALETIRNVDDVNKPRFVVAQLIGFFKLWHQQPQRFFDDKATRYQAARVLFRLAPAIHAEEYLYDGGKRKTAFKDLPGKSYDILGRKLFTRFGPVALNIIRQMEREEEAERERIKKIYEALNDDG